MESEASGTDTSNFLSLGDEYSNLKRAKIAILPVPYERTVTYKKGAAAGPRAIIDASIHLEKFDEQLNQETFKVGIHTMPELKVRDLEPEEMIKKVRDDIQELVKSNKFPVILGGEHSVSIGAVTALKESVPDLSVLYLDAHYDLRNEFNGSRFNHACVARRLAEMVPVVEVGVRSLSKEEKDFITAQAAAPRVTAFSVYDIIDDELWKDKASAMLSKNVYLSIDLDVFDPSLMPAVGTPEPGGIGWYELMDFLYSIIMEKNIVGLDVVELCPIKDQPASDFLAGKMLYRILGYLFSSKRIAQLEKGGKG
ncbi:MAG: agmatinase [Candidatus Omnitrophota bacterium]